MPGLEDLRRRVVDRLEERGRYPRWVLVTTLTGMFATTFPVTILAVSLGDIAEDLGSTETVLAWVISGPLLVSAVALPVLGKMGDLYGHRRVFLTGFGLATVAAALTATAWDAGSLIGFRTLTQVIGAATQPTSMALIMGVFAREERVKAMGWWSLVAAGAPAVGLVVGGPLVEAVGWRLLFLIQAVLALGALAVAAVVLQETTRQARVRFDVTGAATLAVGTGALMLALNQGPDRGWVTPLVLAGLVLAPVGLAGFVVAERSAVSPLLPLHYLRRRNFTAPIVSSLFSGAAYMGGFILAPLLMRFVFDYSLSATAFVMLLRPLSYSLSSPVGGHIATRVGERTMAVAGTGILAVALSLFAFAAHVESVTLVVVALVVQGVGNGTARPSLTASMANSVDEADLGIAAAAQRMVFQVGAAFGIALLTGLYAGDTGRFVAAYVAGAGLGVAALAAATFVRSAPRGPADEERVDDDIAMEATA